VRAQFADFIAAIDLDVVVEITCNPRSPGDFHQIIE